MCSPYKENTFNNQKLSKFRLCVQKSNLLPLEKGARGSPRRFVLHFLKDLVI